MFVVGWGAVPAGAAVRELAVEDCVACAALAESAIERTEGGTLAACAVACIWAAAAPASDRA